MNERQTRDSINQRTQALKLKRVKINHKEVDLKKPNLAKPGLRGKSS